MAGLDRSQCDRCFITAGYSWRPELDLRMENLRR